MYCEPKTNKKSVQYKRNVSLVNYSSYLNLVTFKPCNILRQPANTVEEAPGKTLGYPQIIFNDRGFRNPRSIRLISAYNNPVSLCDILFLGRLIQKTGKYWIQFGHQHVEQTVHK